MSPAQPPRWRRDAVVSLVTTVIVAALMVFAYLFFKRVEVKFADLI